MLFTTNYPVDGIPFSHLKSNGVLTFGALPVLQVDISSDKVLRTAAQERLIALVHDAQELYDHLVGQRYCSSVSGVDRLPDCFGITTRMRNCVHRNALHTETMLEMLREIRGVAKATVTGIEPYLLNAQIADLMKKPVKHRNEIFERICTYKRRGDQQYARRRFEEAERICCAGYSYVGKTMYLPWLVRICSDDIQELGNKRVQLLTACAVCKFKTGNLTYAHSQLRLVLDHPDLPMTQGGKAAYYLGRIHLAQDDVLTAVFFFILALLRFFGYEAADRIIDQMESGLMSIPHLKDSSVLRNIREGLEPVRHQKPSDKEFTTQDVASLLSKYREVLRHFHGL